MNNNKGMKVIRVSDEVHARLLRLVEQTGQSMTFVGNKAVMEYVVREEKKHGAPIS